MAGRENVACSIFGPAPQQNKGDPLAHAFGAEIDPV